MSDYTTVAAYFPSQASAESAISALEAAGFQKTQIGVAVSGTNTEAPPSEKSGASAAHTAGHHAGNAWEKVKSFFSGDAAEPYAGEAERETFNDHVIAPESYGSEELHGSLAGLSMPNAHTRYFGHRLGSRTEGAIVTVEANGRETEAREILNENGGDVGDDAAEFDYGAAENPASAQNIQLYGEVLRVHKDRVSRGEVRLRKEVHSTTQQVEVPVTREELVLERVPVTGEQPVRGSAFEGQEIRIPLSEERATVSKEPVVREEVRFGKKEITNVEAFDEQVRHEELNIDRNTKDVIDKSA